MAQVEELRETEEARYALGGHRRQGRDRLAQVVDALAREQAYGAAQRTARQWVIAISRGSTSAPRRTPISSTPPGSGPCERFNHLSGDDGPEPGLVDAALATAWDDIAPGG